MESSVSGNKIQQDDDTSRGTNTKLSEEVTEDESFLEQLLNVVSADDVENVAQIQRNMLNRFEKTNETLVNCNALGQLHFEKLTRDYRRNTQLFTEMYKDLDWIFHRIRFLKQKLKAKYPDVDLSSINGETRPDEEEEDDNDKKEVADNKQMKKAEPTCPDNLILETTKIENEIQQDKSNDIPNNEYLENLEILEH